MSRSTGPLARLRPVAGPLLLALFVAAAQAVPVLHLAGHRDDHAHGPAADRGHASPPVAPHVDAGDDDGVDARAAAFAGHGVPRRPALPAPAVHRHDHVDADHDHAAAVARSDAPEARPQPAPGTTSSHDHEAPSSQHGRGSSAHFGLALIDGPAPLFLPPPPETLAPAPDVSPAPYDPAPLPQPPARGPPHLA